MILISVTKIKEILYNIGMGKNIQYITHHKLHILFVIMQKLAVNFKVKLPMLESEGKIE